MGFALEEPPSKGVYVNDKYTTYELATIEEARILADMKQLGEDANTTEVKDATELLDNLTKREAKTLNEHKMIRTILDSAAHQQDVVRFREWEVIVKHQEGQFDRLIEQGDRIIELLTTLGNHAYES